MREALIALEVEGYVEVRPGSGIIVTTPESGAQDCSGDEGPLEVLRVRSLIEGSVAEEVAKLIEPKDIAALERILVTMDNEATSTGRQSADREFHLYITAKLENKVLLRMVTGLLDQGERPWARQFAVHFDNVETWTAVLAEHRDIVAALATRKPERARKAMRNHLRRAHDRWAVEPNRGTKTGFNGGSRRLSIGQQSLEPVASLE
jgi:DNA-binding FadR family transcriptional regulator